MRSRLRPLIPLTFLAAACAPGEALEQSADAGSASASGCEGFGCADSPPSELAPEAPTDTQVALSSYYATAPAALADVDGDGSDDLLLTRTEGDGKRWEIRRAKGSHFGSAELWTTELSASGRIAVGMGDVDGDGKADLVMQEDSGGTRRWNVLLSNGSSFVRNGSWSSTTTSNVHVAGMGDANGDGLADLLLRYDMGGQRRWQVRYSTGTSFASHGDWTTTGSSGVATVGLGDVDGDGLADLVLQYDHGGERRWQVRYSNGSAFVSPEIWTTTTTSGVSAVGLQDLNADGKADLLVQYNRQGRRRWQARLSTGQSFSEISEWSNTLTSNVEVAGLGDINADGKADLVLQYDRPDRFRRWQVRTSTGTTFAGADTWAKTSTPNVHAVPGPLRASPPLVDRTRSFCQAKVWGVQVYDGYKYSCGGDREPACLSNGSPYCLAGHSMYEGGVDNLNCANLSGLSGTPGLSFSNQGWSHSCYDELPSCDECGGLGTAPCLGDAATHCGISGCEEGLVLGASGFCVLPGLATVGEPCTPSWLGADNCVAEAECKQCTVDACNYPYQCALKPPSPGFQFSEESCADLYSPITANATTLYEACSDPSGECLPQAAILLGTGVGASAWVSQTYEAGVAYGLGGAYGCYTTSCEGIEGDLNIGVFQSLALTAWENIAGSSFSLGFAGDLPGLEIGVAVATVFAEPTYDTLIATAFSMGLGVGLLPFSGSSYRCETDLTVVNPPSSIFD